MSGVASWKAKIELDIEDLRKQLLNAENSIDQVTKEDRKIKLDLDTKTLESVIRKLDTMLDSIGKGTNNFKQFENLSAQLSSVTKDISNIGKAFSSMNDGTELVNNIKSINTSLTTLSNHFASEVSGRMSTSIKDIKSTLSDVGDGDELTPLLQIINNIESAINELSSSVKGIGLNMNIDFGSDTEMESKAQAKISNALQAYQRLFDHIKMSGVGGQIITDKFFDFDINQYDTSMSKLQAYIKFIENMRNEAKQVFNGQDVLKSDTDKAYWTQASSAMAQVTKTFNEMKAATDTNPLENIFGKTELTEVITQLGSIAGKLDDISNSAKNFVNAFNGGLDVTASVQEVTDLTNRVKELEAELVKIKSTSVSTPQVESNISNGHSENAESANVRKYKRVDNGIPAVDVGNHDNEIKVSSRTELEQALKSLQAEIIASINTSTSFVKEVTDFYDSQDKLVKTQMKVSDNSGNMRTYTTSYSKDKDGNATAWTSHIDTQKFTNQSKEELEVQKQITAEIEAQSKANQKKYQEFQREEQAYQKEQNQIAYDKLTETIRQYSEVAKRVSSGKAEDGDLQKMTQLEEKISQLQKQPILSESQVAKSESSLNSLYDQLDKIEKKLQETNQQKVGNGLEKLSTYRGKSDKYSEPELNLLKDNPFRRVRIKSNLFTRKEKPKSNTQVFIVDEQKKICDTAKKKIAEHPWCTTPLMILLNFQLGLRISEICAIKWSDVEDNYIHIQRMEVEDYTIKEIDGELKSISNGYTIVPYTKSVAGDRKVYLNDSAKKILRQIKKTNMEYGYYDQDFIFIKSQGCVRGTTSAFSQYLTDLCVEAGVMKKSSHKIRKTYISSLFDQKININTIREQAGHEDEQTSLNNYCFDQNTDSVIENKLEHAANKNVCI